MIVPANYLIVRTLGRPSLFWATTPALAVAFTMGCASKKGFSAHQLHRQLGCQYKTAWFLHHRVMEAMREGGLDISPLGGEGKVVEADETYYGPTRERRPSVQRKGRPFVRGGKSGPGGKRVIVWLDGTEGVIDAGFYIAK